MTHIFPKVRAIGLTCAVTALAACNSSNGPMGNFDWDFRGGSGALDTSGAARAATERRPSPDARGVISYPGYQVVVARRGDSVGSIAARLGIGADELARYNALMPGDVLREGEILALPRRVDDAGRTQGIVPASGSVIGGSAAPVDVSSIATTALDRVGTPTPPATTTPRTNAEPVRHQVKRGETAFSIARIYGVSAKALGEWNALGPDLAVREGQYLMIPVASAAAPAPVAATSAPGAGSATPVPPSAAKPLPAEKTTPAAAKPKDVPASPDLGNQRTTTASKLQMPVGGSIIRPYAKGKNDGIDISAAAGSAVKAAEAGTVAAITKDTEQTPIIVIRHDGNLLTVYAGVDAIAVKKGEKVSRGQTIAKVRAANPSFLHFEVRKGVESTDPMPYLQ